MENVRWIAVAGEMRAPAAGMLTITGARDGGNQLTWVGAPRVSQGRAAAAISVVPVAGCIPSEIELWVPLSVWWVTPLVLP